MASSSCCHLTAPTAAAFFHSPSKLPTSLKTPAQRPLSSSHCICPSSALLFCAPRVGAAGIVAEEKKYPPKIVEEDPSWVDDGSGRPPVPAAKEGGGLFGWVTNNKSSREAIQLENTPAQDYNVGQMMAQIKGKGREYGSFVTVPEGVKWWVRELGGGPKLLGKKKPPVVLLHGAPSSSWSYVKTIKQLADKGFHVYAPDWLGFGFSDKPAPGYEFTYKEKGFHNALESLLETLELPEQFYLVTHGFVLGQYGLTWALKHPERVAKLVILNTPLTQGGKLPLTLNQLRLPFVGEFASQNAVLAERFIEKGGPYVLDVEDADVYRIPYLDSSDAGFALLETLRQAPINELPGRLATGFSPSKWDTPTLIAWGEGDKYLPKTEAEQFAKINPQAIQVQFLEGAAHQPQDDWPEKLVAAMARFL